MEPVGQRLHYYRMTTEDVIADLHSHKMGLTNPEAARRLQADGANTLRRGRHLSAIGTLLRQFKSLFVLLLMVSAGLALYLHDNKTCLILLTIAFINTFVGFFQEYKAEKLMRQLEQLLVPRAKVFRNGALHEVDSAALVTGDIVAIAEGDSIPADVRILEENELSTNDFALTGESNPSRKFVHPIAAAVPLASRDNIGFMGTTVATGTGKGIVIATGMRTELGRIASLSQVARADDSPLQREMNNLATRLTQGTIALALFLAVLTFQSHLDIKESLLFAISISAAMIPNGLIAEVNITLAQAANRMAKVRTLIKKLSAVETLGATNVILTDKTGTLTKNEMTITHFLIGRTPYTVTGTGYEPVGAIYDTHGSRLNKAGMQELGLFFICGALASNAKVCQPDAQHPLWYTLGDPTEGAIVTLARKAGLNTEKLDIRYPEIKEFQFDSGRKLMSSVRRFDDGSIAVFIKGAPEAVLERSTHIWDHKISRKLSLRDRGSLLDHHDRTATDALRNLAFAYRILPKSTNLEKLDMAAVEQHLTFLGIVSMEDPLRDDVPAAMSAAHRAHVRVSIITGDYPTTALAIATKAQLCEQPDQIRVIMANDLGGLSDTQILKLITEGGAVFSRVSPEDKLRIVEIAKANNLVVAVTGDGINDAPALKRADIGVAMGKSGTDVAKDAADIILLDDSFGTLVGAIEQGRLTFQNIKKAARCALTDNAGELFAILISLILQAVYHIPLAITVIQILAIDVIAEAFPITALGWDKAQGRLMHEKPRRLSDHILNTATVREFVDYGLLAAVLAAANFLLFFIRRGTTPMHIDNMSDLYVQATTLTYVTLVFCQFLNLLMVRTAEHARFFTAYLWSNKRLLLAFGLSLFCIFNLVYNPLVQPYFKTGPLRWDDWIMALAAAAIYLGVRLLQRHVRKHSRHAVIQLHREIHGTSSPARF
jgi:Ca2+-transporting ATPase